MRKLIVAAFVASAVIASSFSCSAAGPETAPQAFEEGKLTAAESYLAEFSSAPKTSPSMLDAETVDAAVRGIRTAAAFSELDAETASVLSKDFNAAAVLARLDAETLDVLKKASRLNAMKTASELAVMRNVIEKVALEAQVLNRIPVPCGRGRFPKKGVMNELPDGFGSDCRNLIEKPDEEAPLNPSVCPGEDLLRIKTELDELGRRLDAVEAELNDRR